MAIMDVVQFSVLENGVKQWPCPPKVRTDSLAILGFTEAGFFFDERGSYDVFSLPLRKGLLTCYKPVISSIVVALKHSSDSYPA